MFSVFQNHFFFYSFQYQSLIGQCSSIKKWTNIKVSVIWFLKSLQNQHKSTPVSSFFSYSWLIFSLFDQVCLLYLFRLVTTAFAGFVSGTEMRSSSSSSNRKRALILCPLSVGGGRVGWACSLCAISTHPAFCSSLSASAACILPLWTPLSLPSLCLLPQRENKV